MSRPFKFTTAEEVEKVFIQYKEYQSQQYTEKPELIKSGERAGEVIYIKVPDPMQIKSFCLFANIDEKTYYNYLNRKFEDESNENNEDLFHTFTRVHTEIQSKQIAGGLNNVLNPMVVSRLNGLKDSQEIEHLNQKQPDINININGKQIDITD